VRNAGQEYEEFIRNNNVKNGFSHSASIENMFCEPVDIESDETCFEALDINENSTYIPDFQMLMMPSIDVIREQVSEEDVYTSFKRERTNNVVEYN